MTKSEEHRPTWLDEPCPWWCTRTHLEADHPDDRIHEGDADLVAAVMAAGDVPMTTASTATAAVDLAVRRVRRVGDFVEWVLIEATESPSPRLRVTVESARAMAVAVTVAGRSARA